MNARLRIIVQVIGADAAKFKAMQAGLAGITSAGTGANVVLGRMAASMHRFTQFGKNLQWTGRQLEFRFTLPLLLAGAAATKFALDNEKALTRVRKVYGDLGMSQRQAQKEVSQLARGFRALSEIFGVHQAKVIDIAATWAQAGASGVQLGRATKLTLEAMILGSLEAEEAATSLITVMLAYGLTTKELRVELANFNAIENQTAVAFGDLIQVVQKAGSIARVSGIDLRHLAAMAASIVPAAANATEAGTSLKMIILRLYAPTQKAIDAMAGLGIQVNDTSWVALSGEKRFIALGKAMEGLTRPQKLSALADIFEKRQANRALRLIEDMTASTNALTREQSQYARALDATADKTKVAALYTRELQLYLESSPQKVQILLVTLQNLAAEIITPLIPAIIGLVYQVIKVLKWFTKLDPAIQQIIMGLLLFTAVFGPIIGYIGAFITLLSSLGTILLHGAIAVVAFVGPWFLVGVAIAAVIAAIWVFRDEIASGLSSAWNAVVGYLNAIINQFAVLPRGIIRILSSLGSAIGGSMVAVVEAIVGGFTAAFKWVVQTARTMVKTVADAFMALPRVIVAVFKTIVRIIKRAVQIAYEWLSWLNPFQKHSPSLVESVARGVEYIAAKYASLANIGQHFRRAIADFKAFQSATEGAVNQQRHESYAENRGQIATYDPGSLSAFDQLVRSLDTLYGDLKRVGVEFDAQAAIVAEWESALRSAKDGLSGLDQSIFENEQSAKQLRLAILQWEDANGTIDDLESRIADLQGEIEGLRATRVELIGAGAGSNILGPIDAEIARLEAMQHALVGSGGAEIDQLKQQLEELERHGQIMALQREIALDPIQHVLDLEQAKLDDIAQAYDGIEAQIRDMENAMESFASAAQQANEAAARAAEERASAAQARADAANKALRDAGVGAGADLGGAGAGGVGAGAGEGLPGVGEGDFEDVGGTGPKLTGEEGSIEKWVRKMMRQARKAMGEVDIWGPFKKGWHQFEDWLGTTWDTLGKWARSFNGWWGRQWDKLFEVLIRPILNAPGKIRSLFEDIGNAIVEPLQQAPAKIWGLMEDIGGAFSWLWEQALGAMAIAAEAVWKGIQWVVSEGMRIVQLIISEGLGFISEIWNLLWGGICTAATWVWEQIKMVVGKAIEFVRGIINTVLTNISLVWNTIWTNIKGFVMPIWEGIKSTVGGAIEWVWTKIDGVLNTIKGIWNTVWGAIKRVAENLWEDIKTGFQKMMDGVKGIIEGAKEGLDKAWGAIKGVFAKPINFVVHTILNEGFIKGINTILDAIGVKKIGKISPDPLIAGYKVGGVAGEGRQYKNMREPMASDERLAVLHTGEGILPRGAMQKIGRSRFEQLRAGRLPAFAKGGILGGAFGQNESKLTPVGAAIEQLTREKPLVPQFLFGGIIDDIGNAIGDAFNAGANVIKSIPNFIETAAREVAAQAASAAMEVALALLGSMPFANTPQGEMIAKAARNMKDVIVAWIRGGDEEAKKHGGSTALLKALGTMLGVPYSTSGRFGPNFYDCSGFIHAGMRKANIDDSGASGWTSLSYELWTDRTGGRMSVAQARNTAGVLVYKGRRTGPGGHIGASRGDGTVYETPSSWGHKSGISPFGRNAWDAAGRIPHAARGAFVRGGLGGTFLRVGEGLRNELVLPLPKGLNADNLGGEKKQEFHFHGDLSFPNVRDGNDAKAFITNLRSVVDA